jgi:hypothetical protein
MESNKLKYLNDFYSDYMAEQYKRRLPYTKDEYNYQTAVHHMKRNKIL